VGQTQAVVQPLEQNYRRIDGVMGATVLGDGGVALILDIAALARLGTASHFNREKNHGSVGLSAQG
jgi:two-component system chemotaxis sensor kinase CheA